MENKAVVCFQGGSDLILHNRLYFFKTNRGCLRRCLTAGYVMEQYQSEHHQMVFYIY